MLRGLIQLKTNHHTVSLNSLLVLSMVLHHQHHHEHFSAFSLIALSYSIRVHRISAPAELMHQHFMTRGHRWDRARCAEQAKVVQEQHSDVKT
ncbi:uncharacterized [Tachysurus ichikawai]